MSEPHVTAESLDMDCRRILAGDDPVSGKCLAELDRTWDRQAHVHLGASVVSDASTFQSEHRFRPKDGQYLIGVLF